VLVLFCEDQVTSVAIPPEGALTFGRADDCDLRVDHPSVSRRHARVHVGSPLTIEDLGSHNGTLLRGVAAPAFQRVPLHPGDIVECGDAMLLLREIAAPLAHPELRVERQGSWLEPSSGERLNLGRRGPMRRVLLTLVEERLARPGRAIPAETLLAVAWSGERMQHEAGMARVYTTIKRLRALGLHDALETRDDGYLLRPSLVVELVD
jgi:hypothetical protein